MRRYTQWVRRIIQRLHLEKPFILLGHYLPVFVKVVPLPGEYPVGELLTIRRNGVYFKVDRSDYMQWHTYAGLPDVSWRKAATVLMPGSVVLDVGANCGQFSLNLAEAFRQKGVKEFTIHSFEPNPAIFDRLVDNLGLNHELKEYIHCHPLALGEEYKMVPFTYSSSNSGGGTVRKEETTPATLQVQMDRLENIVRTLYLTRVDFIKIDVEGYEPEVLLGAENVIATFRPWIYIEITPAWFQLRGYSLETIVQKLYSLRYELWGEYEYDFVRYSVDHPVFRSLYQFNLLAKPL